MGGVTDPCTDLANAERLVERYGDEFRYVVTWKKSIAWRGNVWQVDDAGVMRLAMRSSRELLDIALEEHRAAAQHLAEAERSGGDVQAAKAAVARANKHIGHAARGQSAPRLQATVALAKNAETIAVDHAALDADPYLLNVANGTIDLRTGNLRPHNPADLITKIAPVAYDPNAKAPRWDAFIRWAMCGDDELVSYLQRLVGYSAIGVIGEHVLGFLSGKGKNGKSTFLTAAQRTLGDYAQVAPRGLLFATRTPQHPTELASLYGARFVTCSEIEEGRAFDEAKVKDLTGGDRISARRMGEDFWSFPPTHTLFIAGNHKPNVRGTDDGIWRRIRVIPFNAQVTPEQMDPGLPAKLDEEASGILAWIVRGALEWQRVGLGDAPAVAQATSAYREESDPLGEFFALRCSFEPEAKTARKTVRGVYEAFCEENGTRPVDARAFANRLRERGVDDGGTIVLFDKRLDAWKGVRLLTDTERSRDVGTSRDQCISASSNSSSRSPEYGNAPSSPYLPTKRVA